MNVNNCFDFPKDDIENFKQKPRLFADLAEFSSIQFGSVGLGSYLSLQNYSGHGISTGPP